MLFTLWPRKRAPRSATKPARRHAAFRPRLEALEDRCVPSTLTVTSSLDYGPGSLPYEISQANAGDTIVFNLNPKHKTGGTITLIGGEVEISKSLTINGQGVTIASEPYLNNIQEFEHGSRIFEVDAGATVAISGLTLAGGGGTLVSGGVTATPYDGYGGAILNFGNLTISGCTLGGNTPVYYTLGGTASDTGLRGNTADTAGGAIANFGTMTVSGCTLSGNTAYGVTGGRFFGGGGGIYNAGTMTVSGGSHVVDNSAGTGGGIENAGTMKVSGCYVQNNSASNSYGVVSEGGGIYNAGTMTVSGSTFSGNSPDNTFGPYTNGGGNTFK
jgi:hypothetical protein